MGILYYYVTKLFSNVLKTGLDHPDKIGPVQYKKPFLIEPAVEPVV